MTTANAPSTKDLPAANDIIEMPCEHPACTDLKACAKCYDACGCSPADPCLRCRAYDCWYEGVGTEDGEDVWVKHHLFPCGESKCTEKASCHKCFLECSENVPKSMPGPPPRSRYCERCLMRLRKMGIKDGIDYSRYHEEAVRLREANDAIDFAREYRRAKDCVGASGCDRTSVDTCCNPCRRAYRLLYLEDDEDFFFVSCGEDPDCSARIPCEECYENCECWHGDWFARPCNLCQNTKWYKERDREAAGEIEPPPPPTEHPDTKQTRLAFPPMEMSAQQRIEAQKVVRDRRLWRKAEEEKTKPDPEKFVEKRLYDHAIAQKEELSTLLQRSRDRERWIADQNESLRKQIERLTTQNHEKEPTTTETKVMMSYDKPRSCPICTSETYAREIDFVKPSRFLRRPAGMRHQCKVCDYKKVYHPEDAPTPPLPLPPIRPALKKIRNITFVLGAGMYLQKVYGDAIWEKVGAFLRTALPF